MLKFGTHIEIQQLRDLYQSKEDTFAHAHVPRAQSLKKQSYLDKHWADRAEI